MKRSPVAEILREVTLAGWSSVFLHSNTEQLSARELNPCTFRCFIKLDVFPILVIMLFLQILHCALVAAGLRNCSHTFDLSGVFNRLDDNTTHAWTLPVGVCTYSITANHRKPFVHPRYRKTRHLSIPDGADRFQFGTQPYWWGPFSNHGLERIVMFSAALVKSAAWTYFHICNTEAAFTVCLSTARTHTRTYRACRSPIADLLHSACNSQSDGTMGGTMLRTEKW